MDSEDSSDDENIKNLIATGIFPGLEPGTPFKITSGSQPGRRRNINKEFDGAARRLHEDCFSLTPKYSEKKFERRFRFKRSRMGSAADSLDEYLEMSEDSVLSLKQFCRDLSTVSTGMEKLPHSIGVAVQRKEKKPMIVLEAICDAELWIWHAFFGSSGSLNDINVLNHSLTIAKVLVDTLPPSFQYNINGTARTLPYYIADGIYPNWVLFLKTIQETTNKRRTRSQVPRRRLERTSSESLADTYESSVDLMRVFEEARNIFAGGEASSWHKYASVKSDEGVLLSHVGLNGSV
eukprot:IDg5756t1